MRGRRRSPLSRGQSGLRPASSREPPSGRGLCATTAADAEGVAQNPAPPNRIPREPGSDFWSRSDDELRLSLSSEMPPPRLLSLIRSSPYKGGFEPAPSSPPALRYEPPVVRGAIPADLRGTLVTNGPGRIRRGGVTYGHWFDGDGYVTSLSLDGSRRSGGSGAASFMARYVRTDRPPPPAANGGGDDDDDAGVPFSGGVD